jgi:hypothetical protein
MGLAAAGSQVSLRGGGGDDDDNGCYNCLHFDVRLSPGFFISLLWCSSSGNHPEFSFAKFG